MAKAGTSITNDWPVCHNLRTMDDPRPEILCDLEIR
jgi:hypothetical protein